LKYTEGSDARCRRIAMDDVWMTSRGAILVDPASGWAKTLAASLNPGAHALVITNELAGIEGRVAGFELRDTLLILSGGPQSRYALLLRKPTSEATVLEQVVETGSGVLNVSACRIGIEPDELVEHSGKDAPFTEAHDGYKRAGRSMYTHKPQERAGPANALGRWPSNLVFVHGPQCRKTGTKRVAASSGVSVASITAIFERNGEETVATWNCEPGCPVRILDNQAGLRPSTLTGRADPRRTHENPGDNHGTSLFGGGNSTVYADTGSASRFYPQFTNDDEMIEWMLRLLDAPVGSPSLPPGAR
jgi:hypothetical protein